MSALWDSEITTAILIKDCCRYVKRLCSNSNGNLQFTSKGNGCVKQHQNKCRPLLGNFENLVSLRVALQQGQCGFYTWQDSVKNWKRVQIYLTVDGNGVSFRRSVESIILFTFWTLYVSTTAFSIPESLWWRLCIPVSVATLWTLPSFTIFCSIRW